jgi:riboflavin synthase
VFTGLVETTATVRSLRRGGGAGARLELAVELEDVELGESISVSGACLTVTAIRADGFEADVSSETLARSTLGKLGAGAKVNIERATRLGARMGGHIVAGHVDGMGRVAHVDSGPDARRLVVRTPPEVQRYLAPKGSVAIDGVSLTVNGLIDDGQPASQGFEVMLVPHTLAHTTLQELRIGQIVNLEADILARYVVRQLEITGQLGTREGLASWFAGERNSADTPARADSSSEGPTTDEALLRKLREGGYV